MAWPEKNESPVNCIGFDSAHLPAIKQAIETDLVKWGESKLYIGYGTSKFKWANCTWKIEEHYELVTSIQLIDGTPDREEMLLTILRGKTREHYNGNS